MEQNEIVPINSSNTDYYAWGRNCYLLGFNKDLTKKIFSVSEESSYPKKSSEAFDLFWEGYYSKN